MRQRSSRAEACGSAEAMMAETTATPLSRLSKYADWWRTRCTLPELMLPMATHGTLRVVPVLHASRIAWAPRVPMIDFVSVFLRVISQPCASLARKRTGLRWSCEYGANTQIVCTAIDGCCGFLDGGGADTNDCISTQLPAGFLETHIILSNVHTFRPNS